MRYNYRERKHYYEPLNIKVLGDYYFSGPEGIYYGGYAWKRISPSDVSRLQTVRQSLGGEVVLLPGEKRLGDVEPIKVDCTTNGKSNTRNGSGNAGVHLLGQ